MPHKAITNTTDPLLSPRRRTSLVALGALVCAFIFFYQSRIDRLSMLSTPSSALYAHVPVTTSPSLPPLLSRVMPPHLGPVHNFTVPHLITYYEDQLPNASTRLYLITNGLMMGYSERNFSAAGCLVGSDIYPATKFVAETITCTIPRRLRPGERLAPVLPYDEVLKRAEEGPVTLRDGVVAELFPGDITVPPENVILHGDLASSQLSDFRLARSGHLVGSSDNFTREEAKFRPRYQLCQMTMVAPNSHMIKDWANYHRRIGVDKIFIFDNGADLDLKKMYEGRVDIEVVSWPYHKCQVAAVTAFLFMSRARCERIFMHDSDEYAMFGLGDGSCLTTGERPMIRYAKEIRRRGYDHVKLKYFIMTNSGFLHRPKGEVPRNFIHRRDTQHLKNGKSICYTDAEEWEAGSIHQCGRKKGSAVRVYSENVTKWGDVNMYPDEPDDVPFLLHYRERSWEEWIEKWDAGRVSGKEMADPKAGKFSMENPNPKFMETLPEMKYTHFRDNVYSRVLKEGRMDEQMIVQWKDGKRCEMLYKIVGNGVTGPVRERCEDAENR